MAKTLFIFIILNSLSVIASTQKCTLNKDQTLKVACTRKCSGWEKRAIKSSADNLDYNVEIVNLNSKNTKNGLAQYDAFLIPGGADIDPKNYLHNIKDKKLKAYIKENKSLVDYTKEGKKRDPFEFKIIQDYFSSEEHMKTPILGICRGMQLLTVSQGIPLYLDIKTELGIENRRRTLDKIKITKNKSLMAQVMDEKSFRGVKYHHQGLHLEYFQKNKSLWPNLEVTSTSNDGKIAESLEFKNRPVLGVQFHPEWTLFGTREKIFSWLLNQACIKKKTALKGEIQ